jgi:hypothetical protein
MIQGIGNAEITRKQRKQHKQQKPLCSSLESEELQNKQENEGQVLIAVYPWNVLMCVWPVCERQCAVDTQ